MLATHVVLLWAVVFNARAFAGSVCTDDFYGVHDGTAHVLPEHFLLSRPVDWVITVPPVCRGEYIAGMDARVCTSLPTPTIRIISWSGALVHMNSNLPTYSSVNVTVYCAPQKQLTSAPTSSTFKPTNLATRPFTKLNKKPVTTTTTTTQSTPPPVTEPSVESVEPEPTQATDKSTRATTEGVTHWSDEEPTQMVESTLRERMKLRYRPGRRIALNRRKLSRFFPF